MARAAVSPSVCSRAQAQQPSGVAVQRGDQGRHAVQRDLAGTGLQHRDRIRVHKAGLGCNVGQRLLRPQLQRAQFQVLRQPGVFIRFRRYSHLQIADARRARYERNVATGSLGTSWGIGGAYRSTSWLSVPISRSRFQRSQMTRSTQLLVLPHLRTMILQSIFEARSNSNLFLKHRNLHYPWEIQVEIHCAPTTLPVRYHLG